MSENISKQVLLPIPSETAISLKPFYRFLLCAAHTAGEVTPWILVLESTHLWLPQSGTCSPRRARRWSGSGTALRLSLALWGCGTRPFPGAAAPPVEWLSRWVRMYHSSSFENWLLLLQVPYNLQCQNYTRGWHCCHSLLCTVSSGLSRWIKLKGKDSSLLPASTWQFSSSRKGAKPHSTSFSRRYLLLSGPSLWLLFLLCPFQQGKGGILGPLLRVGVHYRPCTWLLFCSFLGTPNTSFWWTAVLALYSISHLLP